MVDEMNMNTFCSANWKKRSWNESNYAAESDLDPGDQGPVRRPPSRFPWPTWYRLRQSPQGDSLGFETCVLTW